MNAPLIDTNIIIDLSRNRAEAAQLIVALPARIGISVISMTEFYAGILYDSEKQWFDAAISQWDVYEVDSAIAHLAGTYRRQYLRSYHLDMPDALIAATAQTHGLTLITRNAKHFPMLEKVESPY